MKPNQNPLQNLKPRELKRLRATDPPATLPAIRERTGITHSESAVYRTLTRLMAMNLVYRYRADSSRRQHTYEITALGAQCLAQEESQCL